MTDLALLDATAQAELVRSGDVTPLELVDAAIARIEQLNPTLNAVIHQRFERAREEAPHAAGRSFRGVPILVKDLDGPLAGEPYHLGNRLLKEIGATPDHDSYLIAKLKAAGFVIVGKTNCPEFGLLPTTEPTAYGPTRNPWDAERSAGGSSGGSGAAVASGMVPLAHAGDGGGSIRIPASMCGLLGLKPTRGRVSLGPDDGETWAGLVVRHVITRSVRDCAAVLDLLAGAMPGDPYAAAPPSRPFLEEVGAEVGPLRIGVRAATAPGELAEVTSVCTDAVNDLAAVLQRELGHEVEVASPDAFDDLAALVAFTTIQATTTAHDVDRLSARAGREIGPDDVETLTWTLCERGRSISSAEYVEALETARAWSRRMARWWDTDGDGFDLLLTPTLAEPPPLLGDIDSDAPDPSHALARIVPFGVFTAPFNITGQPAISVPTWPVSSLPIGAQLVAGTGREDLLFRVAAQLEQVRPWADGAPPVFAGASSPQSVTLPPRRE
ncbi:MAG: amidase [Acidimicrobiia bacterium]